jgi:hypothetical protein
MFHDIIWTIRTNTGEQRLIRDRPSRVTPDIAWNGTGKLAPS